MRISYGILNNNNSSKIHFFCFESKFIIVFYFQVIRTDESRRRLLVSFSGRTHLLNMYKNIVSENIC